MSSPSLVCPYCSAGIKWPPSLASGANPALHPQSQSSSSVNFPHPHLYYHQQSHVTTRNSFEASHLPSVSSTVPRPTPIPQSNSQLTQSFRPGQPQSSSSSSLNHPYANHPGYSKDGNDNKKK